MPDTDPTLLSRDTARLIAAANAVRARALTDPSGAVSHDDDSEARLEALFGIGHTLAVYGTLAPGRPNHHIVAPLGGDWTEGVIEGDLSPEGWGATLGYPAFRPREGGALVPVYVLTSQSLRTAWPELDRFEGAEYRRILVPVFRAARGDERQLLAVANVYAAAASEYGRTAPDSGSR